VPETSGPVSNPPNSSRTASVSESGPASLKLPDNHSADNQKSKVVNTPQPTPSRFPAWAASLVILFIAAGIFFLVYGNWNQWESGRSVQSTDDAYIRADVTALSTKASGILARMEVSEYQRVKAGQLIASIRDDDYLAQQDAAKAALDATVAGVGELHRQEEIADAKVLQAGAGITASESQIASAQAGLVAAESTIRTAEAALIGARAQFESSSQERERQEGLYSSKAATLQKLQSQQGLTAAARAIYESRESDAKAAQAQLQARSADLRRAQAGLESSKADVNAATSSRRLLTAKEAQLHAEIEARRAALQSAKIALGYTTVRAPSNGYIASRNVLPGQMVSPGMTVVSLVQQAPWVQANFKETQLTRIRPGDVVEISVDTFPSRSWKGHVLLIAPVTGAQTALLPPENATGNFTKIVQRIPIKISIDPNQDLESLRPGMSATVKVRTSSGG
jgi:membrane fusion protein (multidrug efflux system)